MSFRPLLAAAAVLAFGPSGQAAFFTPTTPTATVGSTGAYWDNTSADTSFSTTNGANVGNYLSATGAFAGNGISPAGLSNLSYDNSAGFSLIAGSGSTGTVGTGTTLNIEVAGYAPSNELWILTGGQFKRVFDGAAVGNNTLGTAITVTNPFVLVFIETQNHNAFFSNGQALTNFHFLDEDTVAGTASTYTSGTSATQQNFALFKNGPSLGNTLYVGMEDLLQGDWDYNDMVVTLSLDGGDFDVIDTPAPPAVLLAFAGIVPGMALRRRLLGVKASA